MKLSFETSEQRTRDAVARHKPCMDCGKSWDDAGRRGWFTFSCSWRCDRCSEFEGRTTYRKSDCGTYFYPWYSDWSPG